MSELIEQKEFTPAICRRIMSDGIKKQDFSIVVHTIAQVPEGEFAKLAGTSSRTISRLNNDQIIPAHAAEVILSVLRAFRKASDVFGSEKKAVIWLKRPNTVLDGNTPLLLLNTRFGAEEVMDALTRIEYGVYY